jgi:hypothetical protein
MWGTSMNIPEESTEMAKTIEDIVDWIADQLGIDPADVDGDGDESSIIIAYLEQVMQLNAERGIV